MRKFLLVLLIALLPAASFAQKGTVDLEIATPEIKISNSLYRNIRLIDIRPDTTSYGIVQKGAFNRKVLVMPKTPLQDQLNNFLHAAVLNNVANGMLLLLVRQLSFAEMNGYSSEKGYCYLRLQLYADKNNTCYPVATIDTLITVRSFDVTKAML